MPARRRSQNAVDFFRQHACPARQAREILGDCGARRGGRHRIRGPEEIRKGGEGRQLEDNAFAAESLIRPARAKSVRKRRARACGKECRSRRAVDFGRAEQHAVDARQDRRRSRGHPPSELSQPAVFQNEPGRDEQGSARRFQPGRPLGGDRSRKRGQPVRRRILFRRKAAERLGGARGARPDGDGGDAHGGLDSGRVHFPRALPKGVL